MKPQKSLFLIAFLILSTTLFAQSNLDSLKTKSYKELIDIYLKAKDDDKRKLISKYYTKKAKRENNIKESKNGYQMLMWLNYNNNKVLIYADSMLHFSLKDNDYFNATRAIERKGSYYYKKRNVKKALDYYLLAREYAHNEHLYFEIHYMLGLIKTRIGKHREALTIHQEVLAFKEKIYEERIHKKSKGAIPPKGYILNAKYAIANSYKDLGLLDSAKYYNKIGLRESKEPKTLSIYYSFLLNQGNVDYLNKSYKAAIDSLKIAEKYFRIKKDVYNYAETSYYLGESYLKTDNTEKAMLYFKKVDSVFNISPVLLPITRNSFEHLINHYKNKNDLKSQLKYLLQLKKMDSVYIAYGTYANNKLLREYDLPLIIGETKRINSLLEKKQQTLNSIIIAISIILMGVFYVLVFQYRRRKLYKTRFNEIVNTEITTSNSNSEKLIEELTISKDIISQILTSLEKFEKSKGFINSEITLQNLAKEFDTNSNYLSKVINHYKKESFSKYITNLRILFVINELKNNSTFRKYTILAIAKEVGFNNSESFSKAFYSKTGIKPSYFIKELDKIK